MLLIFLTASRHLCYKSTPIPIAIWTPGGTFYSSFNHNFYSFPLIINNFS
jgi:hypothetical protein